VYADGSLLATARQNLPLELYYKSFDDISYGLYLQGRSFDFNTNKMSIKTSTNPQRELVLAHKENYCNPLIDAEQIGLGCSVNETDAPVVLGDIKAAALLTPNIYNFERDATAQIYIRNLIQPFPDSKFKFKLSSAENRVLTTPSERDEYASFLSKQAVLDLARHSLNSIYSMRVATGELGQSIDNKYTSPINLSSDNSSLKLIETESTSRYENPSYVDDLTTDVNQAGLIVAAPAAAVAAGPSELQNLQALLQSSNDQSAILLSLINSMNASVESGENQAALMKEMLKMQAFQMWMDYQRYQQTERIEALLATALAQAHNNAGK
jgi:hypothetical protein